MNNRTEPATTTTALNISAQLWPLFVTSSELNGHDFGFVEDVIEDAARMGISAQQVGGAVTALQNAGKIAVFEPATTDSGTWTQFQIPSLYQCW